MLKVEWTDAPPVHVPAIDEEHQALFLLCGDLQRASAREPASREVQAILHKLVSHTVDHFSHEEREMRAAAYAHYPWHRRQHRAALAKVTSFEKRILRGDPDAPGELLEYLSGWLNDHIGIADRMLGAFLRNHQRAQASPAS